MDMLSFFIYMQKFDKNSVPKRLERNVKENPIPQTIYSVRRVNVVEDKVWE